MDRYRIDLRSVDWKIDIIGCVNGSLNCRTRPMINRITSCKEEERDHGHRSVVAEGRFPITIFFKKGRQAPRIYVLILVWD